MFRKAVQRALARTLPASAPASTTCTSTPASSSSSSSTSSSLISRLPRALFSSSRSSSSSAAAPPHVAVGRGKVVGQAFTQSLDLSRATVGQSLEVPYEITLSEADRHAVHSTFFEYNRIFTSTPFARSLGFESAPIPFSLMLGHAVSMSHVDASRDVLDLGFENAVYVRPAYAGDTIRKNFFIKGLRTTSNGRSTVATIRCELFNQHGQLLFCTDKAMLFEGVVNIHRALDTPAAAATTTAAPQPLPQSAFRDQIIAHAHALSFPASRPLTPRQCILHLVSRPLGTSKHLAFCSLYRQAHPLLSNFERYRAEEVVVPGVTVCSMAHSSTSRALFEVLHESINRAALINRVSPVENVGAVTYIKSVADVTSGARGAGLAEVRAVTLGIKNLDITRELAGKELPVALFTEELKPREVEALCEKEIPLLKGKIVVRSERTLLRQSFFARSEQMPLL